MSDGVTVAAADDEVDGDDSWMLRLANFAMVEDVVRSIVSLYII